MSLSLSKSLSLLFAVAIRPMYFFTLHVTKIWFKSLTSSNFDQFGLPTRELAALEVQKTTKIDLKEKWCLFIRSFTYLQVRPL